MKIKDSHGTCVTVYQAKSGKIMIPIGSQCITISYDDTKSFPLYDIEDFDVDLYHKAYGK